MKKTIQKGLTTLLIVLLLGTVLASCGPIFDVGGNNPGPTNPNPPNPPSPPASGYQPVKAYDSIELTEFLASEDVSYAINLSDMEEKNIYLTRNVSIVKPMRIIGVSGNEFTIHAVNRAGGNAFYCLDLQADLEIQYCGFTGYNGSTGSGGGIAAGTPPLNIKAGRTLTMVGNNAVLELRGSGSGSAIRAGSQVKLEDGASIVDNSGALFKSGVEKLIVSGRVSLKNKLTVGEGATLHIDNNGELRVEQGATLTFSENLKELKLDGIIAVDRTASPEGTLELTGGLTMGSLLEKITGNGSLSIENVAKGTTRPFEYGANTIVRLSSEDIYLAKIVSTDIGGEVNTSSDFTIPKGKKLVVGAGIDLNVLHPLTLSGGTLDVVGNVNVTGSGQIIVNAEDRLNAIPKGSVVIGSGGTINVAGGTYNDKSSWELKTTTGSLNIRNGPVYTLSGNATLTPVSNITGTFTVAGGATLTVSGGTLTVRAPNVLNGVNTTQPTAPKIIVEAGSKVDIYYTGNETIPYTLSSGTYSWNSSGWY